MRKVWKYSFDVTDTVRIKLPKGAEIIKVRGNGYAGLLWCLVDPDAPLEEREFIVVGTGVEFDTSGLWHIGTLFCAELVWHIFERVSDE